MKLFFSFFLFLFFLCLSFNLNASFAYAEKTYFAHITNSTTQIYSSPDTTSPIFTLPESYFVELLSPANDNFYYAKYLDVYGYVQKNQVKPISSIPQTPYPESVSFRVFVPSGANLRSTPYNLGATNLIYSIPFLETNFVYYGTINGEESISKKGTIWYYCKYLLNNLSYFGYVYSPLCDCLTPIPKNQEIVEYLSGKLEFNQTNQTITQNQFEGLSNTAQTIIIVAISLPCLLFIYLLFKPTRMVESAKENTSKTTHRTHSTRPKRKISKLKNSDYFELDDDF